VNGPGSLQEQEEAIAERVDRSKANAHKAQTLLDNPLIQKALAAHGEGCFRNWCRTAPDETSVRERIWHEWHAGQTFQLWLQRTVESGKVAEVMAAKVLAGGGDTDRAG